MDSPYKRSIRYPIFQVFVEGTSTLNKPNVELHSSLQSRDARTAAVAEVMQDLRDKDIFITLKGWRNEVIVFDILNESNNHMSTLYIWIFVKTEKTHPLILKLVVREIRSI